MDSSQDLPEEWKPISPLAKQYPHYLDGLPLEGAKKLDAKLNANFMFLNPFGMDNFTALTDTIAKGTKEVPPIKLERILGVGQHGVVFTGEVNGQKTGDNLAIRIVHSNDWTDHPTFVHALVLPSLARERFPDQELWASVVPLAPDLPKYPDNDPDEKKKGRYTEESAAAMLKAIRIIRDTGTLDHFTDVQDDVFGLLYHPTTKMPYRYNDNGEGEGTLIAYVRDRNAALARPHEVFKRMEKGKKKTTLLDLPVLLLKENKFPPLSEKLEAELWDLALKPYMDAKLEELQENVTLGPAEKRQELNAHLDELINTIVHPRLKEQVASYVNRQWDLALRGELQPSPSAPSVTLDEDLAVSQSLLEAGKARLEFLANAKKKFNLTAYTSGSPDPLLHSSRFAGNKAPKQDSSPNV